MRHDLRLPRVALAAICAIALTGCVTDAFTPSASPTSERTARPEVEWTPAGAQPPVPLRNPGNGKSISIRVGDRVHLPAPKNFGGLKLKDWTGRLVPYGGDRTFLAVARGAVKVDETVYDEERPCVPPQPVSTFTVRIGPGPAPNIPAAHTLSARDSTRTVTLVPGQQLTHEDGWRATVVSSGSPLRQFAFGIYATNPGTATVTLTPTRSRAQKGAPPTKDFTVVVKDPSRAGSSSATEASTTRAHGPAGMLAAAPAAAPACG